MRKKILITLFTIAMLTSSIPVNAASTYKLELSKKNVTMYVGEEAKMPLKSSSIGKITFKTSNKKIVSVTGTGLMKAKKAGTAKVTAKSTRNNVTAKVKVKKTEGEPSITLKAAGAKIAPDSKFTIKVKSVTGLSSKAVTFKSSNKKVATVSEKGKVTGKKPGKATITVTSAVNKKVKVKFKLWVAEKAPVIPPAVATTEETTEIITDIPTKEIITDILTDTPTAE